MHEYLLSLSQILSKYNYIPYLKNLGEAINNVLNNKITSNDILKCFIKNPITDLCKYFDVISPNDMASVKSDIKNLLREAVSMMTKDIEKKSANELFEVLKKISAEYDGLSKDEKKKIMSEIEQNKNACIEKIKEYYFQMLVVGTEKLTKQFLRITSINFPIERNMETSLVRYGLYKTYFETDTKVSLDNFKTRFDCIKVATDECVQFQPNSSIYYRLKRPVSSKNKWEYTEEKVDGFVPKLLAVDVTNCHNIFIHDIKTDRFWLMHVSPGSVMGIHPFGYKVKKAYKDLKQNYADKNLGVDPNASLEVVVIDSSGNFDEKLFKQRMPGIITSIKIIKPKIDMPEGIISAQEERKYKYVVALCFEEPKNYFIAIKNSNSYDEYHDLFTPVESKQHLASQPNSINTTGHFAHRTKQEAKLEKHIKEEQNPDAIAKYDARALKYRRNL